MNKPGVSGQGKEMNEAARSERIGFAGSIAVMNMMFAIRPRTTEFNGGEVIHRLQSVASAINAVIGKDGSALDPLFTQAIVLPIAGVVVMGTGRRRPLYFGSAERLADLTGMDVLVLRFDAARGASFDILLRGAARWLSGYLAWRRRDSELWLIPSAGTGPCIRASHAGLVVEENAPFLDLQDRYAGIITAKTHTSFEGWI
ncbi:hypothetical protein [Altericroceibacterium endophyticum]|uniref:Uncharacterized protein n=1 Tax=Altericroceibacterium endophyticum TaxID=1808508 RepID=A0A6I4T4X8_9SPHN|nr:hypothetical protein [Altericroceibacterium endophyticum]MXO65956.1 hypothetical protein [Altericroceibacterium endophyticum]